jgi:uncharacterized protein (TIGR02145 family)
MALTAMGLLSSCDSNKSANSDGGSDTSSGDSSYGIPWNSSISYGTLTDSRDHQSYRTVQIGTQTWMAENLNYKVDSSWCFSNSADSCAKYGRLYQWAAVMGLDTSYNDKYWRGTLPHQGICPSGWHVPSDAEWSTLVQYVDSATSGTKLKSTSGWYNSGNGTDTYGFRVLPASYRDSDGSFNIVGGQVANFWSASEYPADAPNRAWRRYFNDGGANVDRSTDYKPEGFSLRCLED